MKNNSILDGLMKLTKEQMKSVGGSFGIYGAPAVPNSGKSGVSISGEDCHGMMCCWAYDPGNCSECVAVTSGNIGCPDQNAFLSPCAC